jgi:hypothetical protein
MARLLSEHLHTDNPVHVVGYKESIPVEYNLHILGYGQRREAGRIILRFSGVTVPDGIPFRASYDEGPEDHKIELRLEPSVNDIPPGR